MLQIPGVDYSAGRPGGAALTQAGQKYAARYLSHTASKNLTPAEAADLAAHGVWSVVVWETTANRAGAGRAAGVVDATDALEQARACGKPAGRPIYFAVDWDANPELVAPYFQGVISVLGLAQTGGYGGYKVIKYLLDNHLIAWAWQTVAWSAGHWDTRAVLRQPGTTTRIGGVACDRDIATATDYGQWMPGRSPTTEDDMEKTDILTIQKGTWAKTKESASLEAWVTNGNKKAEAAYDEAAKAVTALTTVNTKLDNLTKAVAALETAQAQPIDYTKLAAALIAQLKGA